ncbi:MAG: hypothetical protein HOQ01_05120, partial [Lysobacter sp.]|nr:hypothetical protein [Lysobacter sp.]
MDRPHASRNALIVGALLALCAPLAFAQDAPAAASTQVAPVEASTLVAPVEIATPTTTTAP